MIYLGSAPGHAESVVRFRIAQRVRNNSGELIRPHFCIRRLRATNPPKSYCTSFEFHFLSVEPVRAGERLTYGGWKEYTSPPQVAGVALVRTAIGTLVGSGSMTFGRSDVIVYIPRSTSGSLMGVEATFITTRSVSWPTLRPYFHKTG